MNRNNHIVTLFGGTGDLTYRKLLPAFYNLFYRNALPESFHIVVIGRRELTTETYISNLSEWITTHSRFPVDPELLKSFTDHIVYFKMIFTEAEGYKRLHDYYQELDKTVKHQKLYYLAVDPNFFMTIGEHLHQHNLHKDGSIIIEKPFGNDLKSALEINSKLQSLFGEDHIYRIDHYTAKEMVQNIHTIRFGNSLFEKNWNHEMVESITISASETVGVEDRGNFYDVTGALKDMVQSHLLQILSIVLMDEPETDDAKSVHDKQEEILDNLVIKDYETDVIYGQYASYRSEPDVDPHSQTETYVAFRCEVNHPRWKNVPIYIQTGKKMEKRSTEVTLQFKKTHGHPSNLLVIKVQPDEGIYLKLNIKTPGYTNTVESVFMDFCQSCNIEYRKNTPEAYERLLDAAMHHDHTLFSSFNQVMTSWKFIENILKHTQDHKLHIYEDYSKPEASDRLLEKENASWFNETVYGETYEHESE